MDKKAKIAIAGISAAVIILAVAIGIYVVKKLTPGNEVMLLTDYYKVDDGEVLIILQDEIYDKPGIIADGNVYRL